MSNDNFASVLAQIASGELTQRQAMDRLVPLVYEELRQMASLQIRRERGASTLNTTGLVHEACVKLVGGDQLPVKSRSYFFGAASRAMRQLLADAARRRSRDKRDGQPPLTLDEDNHPVESTAFEVLELDRALERLPASHPRAAQILECRIFGGLSEEETCQALQLSRRSVSRDAAFARAGIAERRGELDRAERLYRQAAESRSESKGISPKDVAEAEAAYASFAQRRGR